MIKIPDPPPVYGMNTVDDQNILKPGECVRLLNAFPGNPPKLINGSVSVLLKNTANYRYLPPGISIMWKGRVYIVVWTNKTDTEFYNRLIVFDKDTDGNEYSDPDHLDGWRVFGYALNDWNAIFDFIELFGCVYCAVSPSIIWWTREAYFPGEILALGQKVCETNLIIRDICIAEEGQVTSVEEVIHDYTETPEFTSGLTSGKWYDYAFQYVRRNDAPAFSDGTPILGMIMPDGLENKIPIRIDTYLPGLCIGVENTENRKQLFVSGDYKMDYNRMSQDGFDGHYYPEYFFDGNLTTIAFDCSAASAGAYIMMRPAKNLIALGLYMDDENSAAEFKIQYLAGVEWKDAAVEFKPVFKGLNTIALNTDGNVYSYWRIYLVNTPGAAEPNCTQVYLYNSVGSAKINVTPDRQEYAIAQGATHLRVSRSRAQTTQVLARGATKFFLCDLPLYNGEDVYLDVLTEAAMSGETNQLITGYSAAPYGSFIEYVKGRLFIMTPSGKVYYSEVPGGDGGTDEELAEAYPQAWASLFKPLNFYLDCDSADGQKSTGIKRLGDDLYFFKERKIFALYGGDPLSSQLTQVSQKIGCSFPYTMTKCEMKGMFENSLLFLSNMGPMALLEGGRVRSFAEMKIKELWPDKSDELYGFLDTDYDWIIQNCSANYFKNTWWVMYLYRVFPIPGTTWPYTVKSKTFGYYVDPSLVTDGNAPHGPFEFEFAEM
jgi:hypothetical protein